MLHISEYCGYMFRLIRISGNAWLCL